MMNDSTEFLLLAALVVLIMLAALLDWRGRKKRIRTIKCQLCDYVGPAKFRWKPFYGKTPVCQHCDSDNVLVVKIAGDSPGSTTMIWADGTHCPECHVDIGLWPVVKAPLPQRIRCPKCGLLLKYARSEWVAVVGLVVLAVFLVFFVPVSWFVPWTLAGPLLSTAIVALLSGGLAYVCLMLKLAMAQHLRQHNTLIKAQDDAASADYFSCKTVVREEGTEKTGTDHLGRRRRWLWAGVAIVAGVILWSICGIVWYQRAQRIKAEARIHYNQAVASADRGEPDKAIIDLSEAIRLNPKLAMALVSRANLYLNKRQLDKAMADYTEAIRNDSKYASAYSGRAAVHNRKGEYDQAIADSSEAIRLRPTLDDGYVGRGMAYLKKTEWDNAIADFTSAIHLYPKSAVVFLGRGIAYSEKYQWDKAIADYTETIRLSPKDADPYVFRGDAYRHKSEFDKALTDIAEANRLDPKNAFAYCVRSTVHRKKGELDQAMADCRYAIRIDSGFPAAYTCRAAVQNLRGEYDKAIADSNEALRLRPKLEAAFVNRGTAYSKKGQFDKAMADFDEALRLWPKLHMAYYARGSSYIDKAVRETRGYANSGKSEYARAIADLTEAIKLDPIDAEAYEKRALAYRALGDEAKAASDENKVKQLRR